MPSGDMLSLRGPPGAASSLISCPVTPPKYVSNLVVRKNFRFVLSSGADGTKFNFNAPKLCALISYATSTTNLVQAFESVKIKKITLWSATDQSSGIFLPRTVAVEFPGTTLGLQGATIMESDMSTGSNRVARVRLRPNPGSQAGQWQSGITTNTGTLFTLIAGQGSIVDVDLLLTVSGDARTSNNSTTVTGPATVTGVYWLSLDNNCTGSLSTGNAWTTMPELVTIT